VNCYENSLRVAHMMVGIRRGGLSKPLSFVHDELDYISGGVVEVPGMPAAIVNWN